MMIVEVAGPAIHHRGAVHHCELFEALEDQMCPFIAEYDRAETARRTGSMRWAGADAAVPELDGAGGGGEETGDAGEVKASPASRFRCCLH
jgi:hypothetical protein